MKNLITLINLSIIFGITAIFTVPKKSSDKDDKKTATMTMAAVAKSPNAASEQKATTVKQTGKKVVLPVASNDLEFITRSVENCLVKVEEGKIAQQQGNVKAVKDQGSLMIVDQTRMLEDLKKIATSKAIITSADMPDNYFALEDLRQLHGEPFDKKFVKKMLYNYKRDVRDLQRATRSEDADIKVFATKYLPVMQTHLDQIKSLKRKL